MQGIQDSRQSPDRPVAPVRLTLPGRPSWWVRSTKSALADMKELAETGRKSQTDAMALVTHVPLRAWGDEETDAAQLEESTAEAPCPYMAIPIGVPREPACGFRQVALD